MNKLPRSNLLALHSTLLALGSALLASSSLAQSNDSSGSQIRHLLELQSSAWNRGDIAGYMDGYWKSDSLIFTSGGTVSRGWQATFDKYARKYDTKENMGTLVFSEVEVTILSDRSAWVLGRWELKRTTDHPHGIFTLVLRKFPEGWKIVHDHTSMEQ